MMWAAAQTHKLKRFLLESKAETAGSPINSLTNKPQAHHGQVLAPADAPGELIQNRLGAGSCLVSRA